MELGFLFLSSGMMSGWEKQENVNSKMIPTIFRFIERHPLKLSYIE
ncbi:hypothetical protein LEP1GSC036_2823 [Leptospira weilii str. 2006001853]|uniref:Uncharacterized protein n=2 Tax=Leptospira weilii TaxID=28184 RepID=A0A828Z829_9LEPT|nr:hypothetical protein LEP1GSC036_2823 [Leptospira weilii str. 2006001853]EMM71269.1 hypothetical protein LEP1GSC038_2992 [Leptospira weilii str. 2006001855]EMN44002.1 hypothetical protein LEP1GSC086_4322 [Leptospira weilii str. LNT 1234]